MAKATADIRSLARAQTALAIRTLTGVCGSKAAPAAARVSAASALLDRGWGKAAQPQAGADGEGVIKIIIRDIAEERRQACRTMLDAPPALDAAVAEHLKPGGTRSTAAPSSEPRWRAGEAGRRHRITGS
jgi:hypothetical protein